MRLLRLLLVSLSPCLLVFLSACSRTASPGRTTLTIWSAPTGVEEKAFAELTRRFERDHPGIAVRNVGGLKEEKLLRAIIAADPPDLAYLYNTTMVGPLAANHAVEPLDARFRAAGFREEQFLPGAIAQGRYDGTLYAMPVTRDSRGFYWNRDVFRAAKLDADRPPRTMEELFGLAVRLTARKPDGSLRRLGFAPPADSSLFFCAMGGRLYDAAAHRVTVDCPENVAALEWLVRLVDAEGGRDRVAAFQSGFGPMESAQNPLALGSVAMEIEGEWLAIYLEKYAPKADYGIGEIPHPAARPDLANMAWQDGDIMVIPAGARHPDAAWEFMRWLQEPAQQEWYASRLNNLPTITALLHSPAITQGSRSKETVGYILGHIAANAANSRYFPTLPVSRLYRDALENAVELAELHRKTPRQALGDAQRRVQRELERYGNG